MSRWMKCLAWAALLTIVAAPVLAQQTPSQPGSSLQSQSQLLSLAEALNRAEKQNLDLQAARAQRAVALAGVSIAKERPNPSISASFSRDAPHEGVLLDQPLELGPKRKRRIALAQQEGVLTEDDIITLSRQIRRDVRVAYFGLLFARSVTAEKTEIARLAQRLKDTAQARFDTGDIAQLELTQADLDLSSANADAQVAKREEQIAQSQLNVLLDAPATSSWSLATGFDAIAGPSSLEELISQATDSNAELSRLRQEAKIEELRINLFHSEKIPNLTIEIGTDLNNPPAYEAGLRGGFSMELPIFSRYQGEIAQSTATLRAIRQETEAKQRAIAGLVEATYYELNARVAEVGLYKQTLVPASKKLEEMAEDSYKSGKTNILTVLAAQRDVQRVANEYLSSLLAMQTSFAEMEETVGVPLD